MIQESSQSVEISERGKGNTPPISSSTTTTDIKQILQEPSQSAKITERGTRNMPPISSSEITKTFFFVDGQSRVAQDLEIGNMGNVQNHSPSTKVEHISHKPSQSRKISEREKRKMPTIPSSTTTQNVFF